jgi:hypothetical protein
MLQEITRLKDIVFHTFHGTLTGLLYTSSLELLLLEPGCSADFKWDPTFINILATDSLIKATWRFLYHNNITLIHDVKLNLPRVHDQFIMEALITLKASLKELRICYHCQMHLHAIFLSDITAGDSMAILESAWNGTPIHFPSKSRSWPSYGRPPRSYWDVWRKWLKIAFLGRGQRLKVPLGIWTSFDPEWPWYLSQDGTLFEFDQGHWFAHTPVIRRNRLPTFEGTRHSCSPPKEMKRASVYFNRSTIVCTGAELIVPLDPIINDSFLAFLLSDKDLHWCLHNIQIQDEHKLLEALHEGIAMAISDGSYKDTFGTAAWTIGNLDTICIISGRAVCPGGSEDHNAYQSELAGIYCIMTILTKFCLFYSIE